jgi:hypothetical protein
MRRVLSLPFDTPISQRLMLLFFTGRKTGRSYRQPVGYVQDGDVLLTPGGGRWKLNERGSRSGCASWAGRDRSARVRRRSGRGGGAASEDESNQPPGRILRPLHWAERSHRSVQAARAGIEFGFRIVRWRLEDPARRHAGNRIV